MRKSTSKGREYDKEIFEFDTAGRQWLYNNDTGYLPDQGRVTHDSGVHDGHDYRHLMNAYQSLGLEIDETDTRGPRPFRENVEFDDPEVLAVAYEDKYEALMDPENEESLFIERNGSYRHLADLVERLKKAQSIRAIQRNRNRINGLVKSKFEKDSFDLSIMEVDRICKERLQMIADIRQKRSLLRFNEKVTKDVLREMRKAMKLHQNASLSKIESALENKKVSNNKLRHWMARLSSLKMPGVCAESEELNNRRKNQLARITQLVNKMDAKLEKAKQARQAEMDKKTAREKKQQEQEKLAGELLQYMEEKWAAEKAMKPLQDAIRGRQKVDWKTLNGLSEDVYEASFGLISLFQHLREINPDLMLELYPKVAKLGHQAKKAYVDALITFTRTHNSFKWSDKAMAEREKYTPHLARQLKEILKKRPEEDEEFRFHQTMTRLPKKVLNRMYS